MAELSFREAIAEGIAQEMARDPMVYFIGEDVGAAGGVFKATVGLFERFGPERVRDTPKLAAAVDLQCNGLLSEGGHLRTAGQCERVAGITQEDPARTAYRAH